MHSRPHSLITILRLLSIIMILPGTLHSFTLQYTCPEPLTLSSPSTNINTTHDFLNWGKVLLQEILPLLRRQQIRLHRSWQHCIHTDPVCAPEIGCNGAYEAQDSVLGCGIDG